MQGAVGDLPGRHGRLSDPVDGNSGQCTLNRTGAGGDLFDILPGDVEPEIVSLADLAPGLACALSDRLDEHERWDARFDVLDELLTAAVRPRVAFPVAVTAAWQLLTESDGACTIGSLAHQVGVEHPPAVRAVPARARSLAEQASRVMRFERAQEMLRSCPDFTLARVAASCGYADQSHMARDWRRLAATSPTDRRREERRFVQDEPIATGTQS